MRMRQHEYTIRYDALPGNILTCYQSNVSTMRAHYVTIPLLIHTNTRKKNTCMGTSQGIIPKQKCCIPFLVQQNNTWKVTFFFQAFYFWHLLKVFIFAINAEQVITRYSYICSMPFCFSIWLTISAYMHYNSINIIFFALVASLLPLALCTLYAIAKYVPYGRLIVAMVTRKHTHKLRKCIYVI